MWSAGVVIDLVWSDDLLDEARRVRAEVARLLHGLAVPGELVLTGGASLPGLLTKGDIDLHLRVAARAYGDAVARLGRTFPVASAHAWADTLAVFQVPAPRAVGLAVTPLGSEHDQRFQRTWQALAGSPRLRAEYNALKTATPGTDEYERRKSDFFSDVVRGPDLPST